MSGFKKLDETEIAASLISVRGWTIENDKLFQEFVFPRFIEAFGFMASVAIVAEKEDHHPEWFNAYNKVRIHLTTDEAGGITANDFALALCIDRLHAAATWSSEDGTAAGHLGTEKPGLENSSSLAPTRRQISHVAPIAR